MKGPGRRAVLFDRDGTLSAATAQYVTREEDLAPIPGVLAALGRLTRAGWRIAVCTNQACIGKGIAPASAVDAIHARLERLAAEHGARLDGIHVCPHRPDEGCDCRKPRPGLLLDAARAGGYDLARSYFVGDSMRDLEAGRAAGATPLLVLTGDDPAARRAHPPELTFPDAAAAADWVIARHAADSE